MQQAAEIASKEIEKLEASFSVHGANNLEVLESLKAAHAQELKAAAAEAEVRYFAVIQEHEEKLRSQKDEAEQAHATALEVSRAEHDAHVKDLVDGHAAEITEVRKEIGQRSMVPEQDNGSDNDKSNQTLELLKSRCTELELETTAAQQDLERERQIRKALQEKVAKISSNVTASTPLPSEIVHWRKADNNPNEDPLANGGDVSTDAEDTEISIDSSSIWDGKTSVEGTLASIQEQVRQLEELNDQIGLESSRWTGVGASRRLRISGYRSGSVSGSASS